MQKEIFIKNLSDIANGMTQKEIATIMQVGEAAVSKYLNPKIQTLPNVDGLIRLSRHFNVSIDWLVGNTVESKAETIPSPRDICKILVELYSSNVGKFKTVSVDEDCYSFPESSDLLDYYSYPEASYNKQNHKYQALYFSEWFDIPEDDYAEARALQDNGNENRSNHNINEFIKRFLKIKEMVKQNMLPQDMYDRLLESYLNEVSDIPIRLPASLQVEISKEFPF